VHEIKYKGGSIESVAPGELLVIKNKHSHSNPKAEWRFGGEERAIYDMAFSPDTEHVALVGASD
jgi:hypothetical protein